MGCAGGRMDRGNAGKATYIYCIYNLLYTPKVESVHVSMRRLQKSRRTLRVVACDFPAMAKLGGTSQPSRQSTSLKMMAS